MEKNTKKKIDAPRQRGIQNQEFLFLQQLMKRALFRSERKQPRKYTNIITVEDIKEYMWYLFNHEL